MDHEKFKLWKIQGKFTKTTIGITHIPTTVVHHGICINFKQSGAILTEMNIITCGNNEELWDMHMSHQMLPD